MTNPQHNGSRPPAVFDAVLVWLTWREYRAKRARQREAARPRGGTQSAPV